MARIFTMAWSGSAHLAVRSRLHSLNSFPVGRTLFVVFLLSSFVYAQDDRATVRDKQGCRPAVATPALVDPLVEGEVDLCTQVVDERGVFVVYLSAVPVEQFGVSHGYLAYWNDASTEQLYVYGRRLFDEGDVGHALLNLERDLETSPEEIVAGSPLLAEGLAEAESREEDSAEWRLAT